MKKLILATLLSTAFIPAFAIDSQIEKAQKYIENIQKNIILPENDGNYVALKKDLYVGKTYNEIKTLQKQWKMDENGIYSADIQSFVKDAQKQKGLNPTGIIDINTWFILYEQPQKWRLAETQKSQENWSKIIEKDLLKENTQMIVVNIPSMTLHLYDKDLLGKYVEKLQMKVVIGSTSHKTPLKDINITSLKYNPTWTPTNNIVKRSAYNKSGEINYKWLEKNDITIYNSQNEIISHADLSNHNFKELRFVQPAGDGNSLGLLKFETDSTENIYLHDTNSRQYFAYNVRTYSSGCIRVENYALLASSILGKSEEHISKQVKKHKTFWEKLPANVPVYFDNSRVWFDKEGTPHFFNQVY